MALNFNLVRFVIDDKERWRAYLSHKKVMQNYHKKYSGQRMDFIPEPQKRSLSFLQLILGINRYRYWNREKEKYE